MDAEQRLFDLLKQVRRDEHIMPIKILRSEASLLALIKEDPGNPVKYYMSKMAISHRGFFNILHTLTRLGLIVQHDNPQDKRQKLLR